MLFFLKAIPECEDPSSLLLPMDTVHLVLRTRMQVMEFKGTKPLLDNMPESGDANYRYPPSKHFLGKHFLGKITI